MLKKLAALEPSQIAELEKWYRKSPCISREVARKLGEQIGQPKKSVAVWFSHRRLFEIFRLRGEGKNVAPQLQYLVDILDAAGSVQLQDHRTDLHSNGDNVSEESSSVICGQQPSFFDRLDHVTRVRLLKACKNFKPARVPKLAAELNLPEAKLRRWFRLRMNNNAKFSFNIHQTIRMEEAFGKNDRINKDEAIALAQKLGGNITSGKVINWFSNARSRRKTAMALASTEATPVVEPPLLARESTPSEQPAPDALLMPETASGEQTDPHNRPILTNWHKNALFEEFKKSPFLTVSRTEQLAARLQLEHTQIRNYFKPLRRQILKSPESLEKAITAHRTPQQLKLLIAEYKKNRYIVGTKLQLLSKQVGIVRSHLLGWFRAARLYELTTGEKFAAASVSKPSASADQVSAVQKRSGYGKPGRLTMPKVRVLKKEFEQNAELTDERAYKLFKRLRVRKEMILRWFMKEREKAGMVTTRNEEDGIKEEPESDGYSDPGSPPVLVAYSTSSKMEPPKPTKLRRSSEPKLPMREDVLYEAFKESPHLSSSRLLELSQKLELDSREISRWFATMRRKLTTVSAETLLESYRNRKLTEEQANTLEQEFVRHPYIGDEDREKLSAKLGITKGSIKKWFDSRRCYEIVFHAHRMKETTNDVSESDFNPIITFCSTFSGGNEVEDSVNGTKTDEKPLKEERVEEVDPLQIFDVKDEFFEFEEKPLTEEQDADEFKVEVDENSLIFPELLPEVGDVEKSRRIVPLNDGFIPAECSVNDLFRIVSPENKGNDNGVISPEAEMALEAEYATKPQPRLPEIYQLSSDLQLSPQCVYWWYMTKRYVTKISQKGDQEADVDPEVDITDQENNNSTNVDDPKSNMDFNDMTPLSELKEETFKEGTEGEEDTSITSLGELESPGEGSATTSNEDGIAGGSNVKRCDQKFKGLTILQKRILTEEFKKCPYVSNIQARIMAEDLGLSVKKIDWFFAKKRLQKPWLPASQVSILEEEYASNPKLSKERLKSLVSKTGARPRAILQWFKDHKA